MKPTARTRSGGSETKVTVVGKASQLEQETSVAWVTEFSTETSLKMTVPKAVTCEAASGGSSKLRLLKKSGRCVVRLSPSRTPTYPRGEIVPELPLLCVHCSLAVT